MPNINELFIKWGKSQRQTPPRNDALKSEILARVPELRSETPKWKIPWVSLAFAGLAVLTLIIQPSQQQSEMTMPASQGIGRESTGDSQAKRDAYYPTYNTSAPITDDREFLKTDYHAEIRTRNVGPMTKRIQTIVHAFDGRIDSLSSSEKNGYVSFALPATKFDAFQTEINSLTYDKLIAETVNAHNVLPQKQVVERQIEDINKALQELLAQPRTRERDEKIKSYESELQRLNKENQAVVDNVATVNGTISLRWVSVWEVIELYAGPYWLPILLGIAAIIAYVSGGRKAILLP